MRNDWSNVKFGTYFTCSFTIKKEVNLSLSGFKKPGTSKRYHFNIEVLLDDARPNI